MIERRCVLCGTPGKPGRFSCNECGGAVVDVRSPADMAALTRARAESESGAATGAPPPPAVPSEWMPPPAPKGAEPSTPGPRTPVWAYVMAAVLVVLLLASAGSAGYMLTRPSHPVPKELRAYARGDGDIYKTSRFSVRLPYDYTKDTLSFTIGDRAVSLDAAAVKVGATTVGVAWGGSGLGAPLGVSQSPDGATLARAVAASSKVGGRQIQVHEVNTAQGHGFDVKIARVDGTTAIGRLMGLGNQMVFLFVVSKQPAGGVLRALIASYQPA